jgi:hypothetical protein
MAVATTNTVSNTSGLAENFSDIVWDVSPTETPFLTMAKRVSVNARVYQWQEDALDTVSANYYQEGDDASFVTSAQTTSLSSPMQISRKTVNISGTLDAVKKYGRKSETAFQLAKAGKALKRDMEYALIRNQTAVATGTTRQTGGFECWISSNVTKANDAQTQDYSTRGFSSGTVIPPQDGSLVTFIEADLKSAIGLAWTDGGDPSVILMSAKNKGFFDSFSGVATKYREVTGMKQGTIVGASDLYISSYGTHAIKPSRYVRDEAVLCIDPDYVAVGILRDIQKTELAATGDGSKWMLLAEYGNVILNRDAHAIVGGVGK